VGWIQKREQSVAPFSCTATLMEPGWEFIVSNWGRVSTSEANFHNAKLFLYKEMDTYRDTYATRTEGNNCYWSNLVPNRYSGLVGYVVNMPLCSYLGPTIAKLASVVFYSPIYVPLPGAEPVATARVRCSNRLHTVVAMSDGTLQLRDHMDIQKQLTIDAMAGTMCQCRIAAVAYGLHVAGMGSASSVFGVPSALRGELKRHMVRVRCKRDSDGWLS
jgi:hypothetical protein